MSDDSVATLLGFPAIILLIVGIILLTKKVEYRNGIAIDPKTNQPYKTNPRKTGFILIGIALLLSFFILIV
jgi:hypothetical protein